MHFLHKVSSCGMSDAIGPIYVKDRPGVEMESRIDAEVMFLNQIPNHDLNMISIFSMFIR